MIARCPHCGLTFESQMFKFVDTNVSMSGNKETCPRCKRLANLEEGYFEYDENGLRKILSSPNFTREILLELKDFVETVQTQNLSKEEILDKVDTLNPVLRFIKDWIIPKDQTALFALLAILVPLIWSIIDSKSDKPTVINSTNIYVNQKADETLSQKFAKMPDLRKNTHRTLPRKKRKRGK